MRKIAISSIHNGGDDLLTLYYYSEMVKKSEKEKFYLLYREIITASAEIVNQSILKGISKTRIKIEFERLDIISTVIMNRLKEGDVLLAFLPLIDASPGFPNNMHVIVTNLLNLKNREDNDFTLRTIERYSFDTMPYVTRCLLKIISLAVDRKHSPVVKYSMNTLYLIATTLLNEKLRLELNFDNEVHHIIEAIYSSFTRFFIDADSLDDSLFDEILDVLTTLALQCIISDKQKLAIESVSKLQEACYHVAKFDEFGYSTTRIAERIMMIGVLGIEMNIDSVTKKVVQALESYDEKIKDIIKEFQPRVNVSELKKEIDMEELMFEPEISPKKILKDKVSNDGWSKSDILNSSN